MTRGSRGGCSFAQLTWPFAALVMLLLLGCQSTGGAPASGDGWRVVEQTGDVRFSPRSSERWATVAGGDLIAPPGVIVTGAAGRVILARADQRLRLAPSSRIALPPRSESAPVEQQMGQVEYQLAADQNGRTIRVSTPHGEVESRGGRFAIEVGTSLEWTALDIRAGAARIATLDGSRGVTLRAGQRAEAGAGDGTGLAFNRTPGGPLEAVVPLQATVAADDLPAASSGMERAIVATVRPERHPAARSALAARPPASSMTGELPAEAEDHGPPAERIILPATFQPEPAPGAEEAQSPEGLAAGTRSPGSQPDDLRALTDNLLEGLEGPLAPNRP